MPSHRKPTSPKRRAPLALTAAIAIGAGSTAIFAGPATAAPDTAVKPAPAPQNVEGGAVGKPVRIGPGSPIRMPAEDAKIQDGRHVRAGMCSTGVPGTVTDADGNKHRVIITAGHCLTQGEYPGMPAGTGVIYAPTPDGDVRIGEAGPRNFPPPSDDDSTDILRVLDSTLNGPDWGFIEVDDGIETTSVSQAADENGGNVGEPTQMTGIVDYKDLKPGQVSVDNFGKRACTDGTRTGRQCGYQVFRARNGVWVVALQLDKGDSGGNAYDPDTNQVIGVNSMAVGPLNRIQPADIAIQEAYGIEDGKVNDHFEVENSTEPQSEFRTISEDVEYAREHGDEEQGPPSLYDQIRDIVPGLPEESPIPLPVGAADVQVGPFGVTGTDQAASNVIAGVQR